jgi:hypothetical protein
MPLAITAGDSSTQPDINKVYLNEKTYQGFL